MSNTVEKSEKQEKALKIIMDLSREERAGVVTEAVELMTDEEREDLLDYLAIEEVKKKGHKPIPLAECLADYEERHKKKAKK